MKKKINKLHLHVTEDDYKQGLAQGMAEEALLTPGRHTFKRGGFRERHPDFKASMIKPRNIKVCVTIRLDLDVLNYFKELAAQPNAAPYETQINKGLRAIVEHATISAGETTSIQMEPPSVDHNVKTVAGRKGANSTRKQKASTCSKARRYNLIPTGSLTTTQKRNVNLWKSNFSSHLKEINNSLAAKSSK